MMIALLRPVLLFLIFRRLFLRRWRRLIGCRRPILALRRRCCLLLARSWLVVLWLCRRAVRLRRGPVRLIGRRPALRLVGCRPVRLIGRRPILRLIGRWTVWLICRWTILRLISRWTVRLIGRRPILRLIGRWTVWLICRRPIFRLISRWTVWLIGRWPILRLISRWTVWLICRWTILRLVGGRPIFRMIRLRRWRPVGIVRLCVGARSLVRLRLIRTVWLWWLVRCRLSGAIGWLISGCGLSRLSRTSCCGRTRRRMSSGRLCRFSRRCNLHVRVRCCCGSGTQSRQFFLGQRLTGMCRQRLLLLGKGHGGRWRSGFGNNLG